MNKKLKKILKRTAIGATGFIAFAGAVVGGYLVTPNRTKIIDVSVPEREKSDFERFVAKLTKDVGINEQESEEEVESYLSARFSGLTSTEKFNISYKKDEESTFINTVAINSGEIDFRMAALDMRAIELNVDMDIDYNGKMLPITLGHFGDETYFRLKDMKMKITDFNLSDLPTKYFLAFEAYANLDAESIFSDIGTAISDKLGKLLDDLISGKISLGSSDDSKKSDSQGGFDFNSFMSGPTNTIIDKERELTIFQWTNKGEEKSSGYALNLVADSESLSLKRVELDNISFGTVAINGAIDVEIKPYKDFVSPCLDGYVEVFNYTSLTGKLLTLLKEGNQKLGLEFGLDLDQLVEKKIENSNETYIDPEAIGRVEGSINVDFDKLLDLSQYMLDDKPEALPEDYKVIGDFKDVGFNFQLKLIGNTGIEYANMALVFADGVGYLRFNEQEDSDHNKESVLKLYFDTETMNWITSKIPELIDGLSQDSGTDTLETLSKFLSEDLVDSINNFDFSFILDMLKTLKNDESGFELGIDLSKLNIGENAEVIIRVDNDVNYFQNYFNLESLIISYNELRDENGKLTPEQEAELDDAIASFQEQMAMVNNSGLNVDVKDLAFGNFALNANVRTAPFSAPVIEDKETYQSTKFIPDVVDQVTDLAKTKKTGFRISGSMLDDANLGIRFNGQGRLDNNDEVKEGYGNMTINQYKYNGNQVWATHEMYVNVTNLKSNIYEEEVEDEDGNLIKKKNNQNEALFVYGNPDGDDNIKGKVKLQTFTDIFDIVMTFIDKEGSNPKYTKFLAPITKVLGMNTLSNVIESKNYFYFLSNDLLKKINVVETSTGTDLEIVVNKNMFGMNLPADITLTIKTKINSETNKQELSSLVIEDLVLSDKENASKLNLLFELEDYENGTVNRINKKDNFMSLDGIKTLLDLGINTTKVNFYHLSAEALIRLGSTSIIKPDLKGINFYVYVDGVHVKVYGTVDSIPSIFGITIDDFFATKDMAAEFSFETYDDDDNDNKVGGYFNIRRYFHSDETERIRVGFLKYEYHYYHVKDCYHYRCDSTNFLENIAQYLITGLLGIKESIYLDSLTQEQESSSDQKEAGNFTNAFTDTGFQSYKEDGNDVIKLGLNLDELTGINALKELEATITSKHISYQGSTKGMDVLGSLVASLRINFAVIFNINITLTANVVEAVVSQNAALERWNDTAQAGFGELTKDVITLSNNSSVNVNNYLNNPSNPAQYQLKEEYFK